MTAALILLALVTGIAALNLWSYRFQRNGEWHYMNFRSAMRRYIKGRWHYRQMTKDELRDQDDRFS